MQVWVNGEFVDRDEAKVSVFDAGIQHAVGLFETMHARNGRVFRVAAHLQRLAGSAGELMLTERLWTEPLAEAVQLVLERNEMQDARVRLTVTGGDLNLLQSEGRRAQDPTVIIVAQPPTTYPAAFFEQGVMVSVAESRANPASLLAGHKSLDYWERIQSLQQAAAKQAAETLWFDIHNHLMSGAVSNLFVVKDGTLVTPLARGEEEGEATGRQAVLPGVTRAAIAECAEARGIEVERRVMDFEDLRRADECFLTNSSWGVLPVVAMERMPIASAEVGPLTRTLRQDWLDLVQRETTAS